MHISVPNLQAFAVVTTSIQFLQTPVCVRVGGYVCVYCVFMCGWVCCVFMCVGGCVVCLCVCVCVWVCGAKMLVPQKHMELDVR